MRGRRSAEIYFYGKSEFPEAVFHWDQCELFRFKGADRSALGAVLKRWICDNAMPSTMRKELAWLKIGGRADYYESGNPIEGEFIHSWDRIEQFYDGLPSRLKGLVPQFIAELRQAGYDRKLRAGQSLITLIVSRSRRHGLRAEQPCIRFQFGERTMDVLSESNDIISGIAIAMSSRVEEALTQLAKRPIS